MKPQTAPVSKLLVISVGLICFAVSFALSTLWPLWEQREQLVIQAAKLSAQRAELAQANETELRSDADQPRPEEAASPKAQPAGGQLRELLNLATSLSLNVDSVSYRVEREGESAATRYQVTMPLKTSYANVRKFIDAALALGGHVSLERLSMQRSRATDPAADVELVFMLRLERSDDR